MDFEADLGLFSFQKIASQSETFIKLRVGFFQVSSNMMRLGRNAYIRLKQLKGIATRLDTLYEWQNNAAIGM